MRLGQCSHPHIVKVHEVIQEAAMSYIEANRAEVEAEYQTVLKQVEENQKYWEERNRERFARIAKLPPPPGMEVAWEKLQKAKARLDSKA